MIDKPADVTNFDKDQVPVLGAMMDKLYKEAAGIRQTNVTPTTSTVHEGEIVIYDDGSGVREMYTITKEGNLGKIRLSTQAHIIDADGTLADITTKFNTLLSYLETAGILATS